MLSWRGRCNSDTAETLAKSYKVQPHRLCDLTRQTSNAAASSKDGEPDTLQRCLQPGGYAGELTQGDAPRVCGRTHGTNGQRIEGVPRRLGGPKTPPVETLRLSQVADSLLKLPPARSVAA
jgi:hypothetical protein